MKENVLARDAVPVTTTCEKARVSNGALKEKNLSTSKEAAKDTLRVRQGWFEHCKRIAGIHLVIQHGETANVNFRGAEVYTIRSAVHVAMEGYITQQVSSCNEKRIAFEEVAKEDIHCHRRKKLSGNKPKNYRLILAFCATASCDCKLKPQLEYHSNDSRAIKSHLSFEEKQHLMRRAKARAFSEYNNNLKNVYAVTS